MARSTDPPDVEEARAPDRSAGEAAVGEHYRSQLTTGEDVVDPETWAGSIPAATGVAPRGADRSQPLVQPRVVAAW